jgi:hypothetical protein
MAIALSGCAGWSTASPLALGPYPEAPRVTFERVADAVRAHGYALHGEDAERGTFSIDAREHTRRDAYSFTFQFHRGGWVQVVPNGDRIRREGDAYRMPDALAREYRDLVIAVRDAIGPGPRGLDR